MMKKKKSVLNTVKYFHSIYLIRINFSLHLFAEQRNKHFRMWIDLFLILASDVATAFLSFLYSMVTP